MRLESGVRCTLLLVGFLNLFPWQRMENARRFLGLVIHLPVCSPFGPLSGTAETCAGDTVISVPNRHHGFQARFRSRTFFLLRLFGTCLTTQTRGYTFNSSPRFIVLSNLRCFVLLNNTLQDFHSYTTIRTSYYGRFLQNISRLFFLRP